MSALLKDSISFCILQSKSDWRAEFTSSVVSHYSRELGGTVITAASVTEALRACSTKYLLILRAGMVILSSRFFDELARLASESRDIVIGDIQLGYDYAFLRDEILFVNIELWKRYGQVSFEERDINGPAIVPSEQKHDDRHPAYIFMDKSQSVVVGNECYDRGAKLLIAQMKAFFDARSLPSELRAETYYLDSSSLGSSLRTETQFESEVLPRQWKRVDAFKKPLDISQISVTATTAVLPAHGLYTLEVAKKIGAKNIIIYSNAASQLTLQRKIFELGRATNYENILHSYLAENPEATVIGEPKDGRSVIIQPAHRFSIQFVLLNPVGYELQKLINKINIQESLVVDIGSFYSDPLMMYKREPGSISAFFEMFYAQLAGRPGATFLIGTDPSGAVHLGEQVNNRARKYSPAE